MDSLITAAARALAAGDPLGALNRVALREDAPALALRGIAMAQLGDLARARALVRRAARAFGPREAVARARCVIAEAEIALASRDLAWPAKALEAARESLEAHGDRLNAAHARVLEIRRLLLLGRLDQADRALAGLDAAPLLPALSAAHELAVAGIALRRLRTRAELARRALETPAARRIARGEEKLLRLDAVEALLASNTLVIDACRRVVRDAHHQVLLTTRPVLFALARALAEAWPNDVTRATLLARAFGARSADASHRARLRVEIGRLRKMLRPLAAVTATATGFALVPRHAREVAVLALPSEDEPAPVLALLSDGESWSTQALALALGASQRTVQRALRTLAEAGKAQAFGRGRARRWITPPVPGFTTQLLLPAPLPGD